MQSFITENLDEIVSEWEAFARIASPASASMDPVALRDHVRQMLQAIALDIQTTQSDREQYLKSKGLAPPVQGVATAAELHGTLRYSAGFDLGALVAEFRALRATVLRLWVTKKRYGDDATAYEIARFNEAIDQALAESVAAYSEELNQSRDTFMAILGHDLSSPLIAVEGALRILSSPDVGAPRSEASAAGSRHVSSMKSLIRDLLEYTSARLGKGIPIVATNANLERACMGAISEVSLIHPQTTFRLESSGKLDGFFDSSRIQQAAANLLNNAVQYGKRGAPVVLIAKGDQASFVIQVKVAGEIAGEFLSQIFDPLVRSTTAATDPSRSTNAGLGLFIAREIVLAHAGAINVSSTAEDGTVFTVELPNTRSVARGTTARPQNRAGVS